MDEYAQDRRQAINLLKNLRARLHDENAWSKGFFALTANGTCVRPTDPTAARWCLETAFQLEWAKLASCSTKPFVHRASRTLAVMIHQRGFGSLIAFNDDEKTTFYDVRAVIDDAILELHGVRNALVFGRVAAIIMSVFAIPAMIIAPNLWTALACVGVSAVYWVTDRLHNRYLVK